MSAFLHLLLIGSTAWLASPVEYTVILADGRLSDVLRVREMTGRCGLHPKDTAIMRHPPMYRKPNEPSASLEAAHKDVTPAVRKCMRQHKTLLRKVQSDLR